MAKRAIAYTLALAAASAVVMLASSGSVAVVDAHGMHGMHGAADVSKTDHKCPVCRMSTLDMGYDNANYVEMKNGQRVYTCGMDPRPFDGYNFQSTDTAYLGANMAEFIVATDDTDNYKCTSACEECASSDLRDPISGVPVTADNYKIVCLVNGQKIYFASDTTRTAYLGKINTEVRASVEGMYCNNAQCSDATQIATLSAAAKAFDPSSVKDAAAATSSGSSNTSSSSNSTSTTTTPSTTAPAHDHATSSGEDSTSGFCSGEGSVMFNGFSSTINGSCVLLFFKPWVLNSAVKYFFGFLGCLLLSFGNEYLVKFREQLRQKLLAARKARADDKHHRLGCKALLAFMYMIQMTVAYFAMLVVMTYETGLFIALILGFGAGFVLFKDFDVDVTAERGVWRFTDPSVVRIRVEGMSCMANCGTTVENALAGVEGVTKVHVEFDEKCAYVAGAAPYGKLLEAVEAVGFSAQLDQSNAFTPANVLDEDTCSVKKTV